MNRWCLSQYSERKSGEVNDGNGAKHDTQRLFHRAVCLFVCIIIKIYIVLFLLFHEHPCDAPSAAKLPKIINKQLVSNIFIRLSINYFEKCNLHFIFWLGTIAIWMKTKTDPNLVDMLPLLFTFIISIFRLCWFNKKHIRIAMCRNRCFVVFIL